ncbi:type II secretion system F family protein [Candidatus Woesearchaeota archaeon]|nr:type II secretion system F family protein [Candidatus Woesearchaeota archaeon]
MTQTLRVRLLDNFGKAFLPRRWRLSLRAHFLKAGILEVPYHLIGLGFHLTTLLTLALFLLGVLPAIVETRPPVIVVFLTSFLLWAIIQGVAILAVTVCAYIYLDLRIYRRTLEMEEVLDQYLGLVSENLKGGMALERALWDADRPEFGTLSSEIQLISKRVATGEDVAVAFRDLILRYDSPMMRRTFNLILEAMGGGGRITDLLDRIVANLKETKLLKQEMVATNTGYTIFISAISLAVAPMLFALSYQLLLIFGTFTAQVGTAIKSSNVNVPFGNLAAPLVSPKEFTTFARAAITTVSICSSMIVSMISRGDIKGGLKYLPIFLGIALVVFTVIVKVLSLLFSGLFSG